MEKFIKKNLALSLAFVLPIVLILIIALITYVPSLYVSTDYNFLYASCVNSGDYYSHESCNSYLQKYYTVVNNRLTVNSLDPTLDYNKDGVPDFNKNFDVHIFLHNTQKNESREVTLEQAQGVMLSNLLTSPDGVTISNDYNQGGYIFPFGGGPSSYGHYLKKGRGKVRMNTINNNGQSYYQDSFQFIGWVSPGRN